MKAIHNLLYLLSCVALFSCGTKNNRVEGPRRIEILFLGHDSEHHNSAQYLPMLASNLLKDGINFTYTDDPNMINSETLSWYDGLMIYANHDSITADQEAALLAFVSEGKGFLPIHCASYCFRNSDRYIDLVGGQFQRHDTATFTTEIINHEHPVTHEIQPFSTWDETYFHHQLSDDREVLMERVEGDHREPWTWTKTYGEGRIFYTAYGHDERTWNNPGFQSLIKQGIAWAVGDRVREQWEAFRESIPTLTYQEVANIPNYEKRTPAPRFQEPLSPQESKTLIQVPVGFSLELFASEPDIINPIAMDWDERGRLWVIETVDYPNSVRDEEGVGDDRIKICEDTDGDGRADKFTIFADKLNIPTSLVFVNGGIIVSQAPVFLFLKDTDGDDKADVRSVIMDGWGTFDTHAGPSNLRYGFDNQIWGTVGYSGFKGNIAGKAYEFAQGFYRFPRDVSDFTFMTNTTNNTWGLGFTEDNDVFGSTANNTHSVFMGIPNETAAGVTGVPTGSVKIDGHYAMHSVTPQVRQVDVFGGFTAAAGHSFYTARNYPSEYWNKIAFVCEPTGHLVHMARIEEDGAGFVEKDGWNLFAGADEWVSPVEAEVGPDGAVWVLDWYNFIVQHNPTPTPDRGGYEAENGPGNAYENPLRDKSHGRVWRIVNRRSKEANIKPLSMDRPDELVASLQDDNLFWRLTAQRLLVERNQEDVIPDLIKILSSNRLDDMGNAYDALHALWALDGLGVFTLGERREVLDKALTHSAAAVRKAAIQIYARHGLTEKTLLDSRVLFDNNAHTRLEAILATRSIPSSETMGKTLYALSKESVILQDTWLAKSVYVAATTHSKGFVDAFLAEHPDFAGPGKTMPERRESKDLDDSAWQTMNIPTRIERAGLDIDGIIWFRTTVMLPAGVSGLAELSLGPVNDSDDTWVNGTKIGATERDISKHRIYRVPAGVLKPGKNIIAVKVQDFGGSGGIYGAPEQLYLAVGNRRFQLAGEWRFEVEREFSGGNQNPFKDIGIADLFVDNYYRTATPSDEQQSSGIAGATVITVKVIPNEMKYDLKSFTVEAGKPIELVLVNPDFMQHNLVVAKPGSLQTVGAAADKLASDPNGAGLHYVPDIPEVLFATELVDPQKTVRIQFIAPADVGDYPFICTFPGHWSIMNGVMRVVQARASTQ
jgi:putative membrane-bound dehydrogenase-like protein